MVITSAQLHSTKPELRFHAGSSPACVVSEIRDGEDLGQWFRLEIRPKRLSSVNHIIKTIHHHSNSFTEADMAKRCDYELGQLRITIEWHNTTLVFWGFAEAIKYLSRQQFDRSS